MWIIDKTLNATTVLLHSMFPCFTTMIAARYRGKTVVFFDFLPTTAVTVTMSLSTVHIYQNTTVVSIRKMSAVPLGKYICTTNSFARPPATVKSREPVSLFGFKRH